MLRGYRERKDVESRERWEQVRMQVWYTIQPHLKKGANTTPQKLLPMPWDVVKVTNEEDALDVKMRHYERLIEQGATLAPELLKQLEAWRSSMT